MRTALMTVLFANYYGFDKFAREVHLSRTTYRGQGLCTLQVTAVAHTLVFGVIFALDLGWSLPYAIVVAACLTAVAANYVGVIQSAAYPAFRTRMDRQPFRVKFGQLLLSWTFLVVAIGCLPWQMHQYYTPAVTISEPSLDIL
ncbi:hypothetical protein [Hymenobacter cavernae]|uniref:Uncharacterized protein n=1 Tax=Hymenobacter cavernae TaxID=2044852 RepID=A0ABQ1UY30_9BACT|nr:hypothetical protein [Hymenobacter cavernae]GGF28608.1 hypothetical protein GCM10011383_45410 [Hymenobacter cavernae]